MLKRMIIMLCGVGAVFAGLAWFVDFRAGIIKKVMATLADPPQTVSTTVAGRSDWQPRMTAIGTFRAVNGADLSLGSELTQEQVDKVCRTNAIEMLHLDL